MRIVRLKRGYRLSLSDSEFAALSLLLLQGLGEVEGFSDPDYEDLTASERRGLKTFTERGFLQVHDDRR